MNTTKFFMSMFDLFNVQCRGAMIENFGQSVPIDPEICHSYPDQDLILNTVASLHVYLSSFVHKFSAIILKRTISMNAGSGPVSPERSDLSTVSPERWDPHPVSPERPDPYPVSPERLDTGLVSPERLDPGPVSPERLDRGPPSVNRLRYTVQV